MRENTAYFCGYFFMFKKLICGIFAVAGDFKTPFYNYELKPSSHNPDRAGRPSITEQLKETVGRLEKSKEPEKQKHHKAHEGR